MISVLIKKTNEVVNFADGTSPDVMQTVLSNDQNGTVTEHKPGWYERFIQEPLAKLGMSAFQPNFAMQTPKPADAQMAAATTIGEAFGIKPQTRSNVEAVQDHPVAAFAGGVIGGTAAVIGTGAIGEATGLMNWAKAAGTAVGSIAPKAAQVGTAVAVEGMGKMVTTGTMYETYRAVADQLDFANPDQYPDLMKIAQGTLKGVLWAPYGVAGAIPSKMVGASLTGAMAYAISKAEGQSEPDALLNAAVMSTQHAIMHTPHDPVAVRQAIDHLQEVKAAYTKAKNGMVADPVIARLKVEDAANHAEQALDTVKNTPIEPQDAQGDAISVNTTPDMARPGAVDPTPGAPIDVQANDPTQTLAVHEVSLDKITLSADVPNFKDGADPETGVILGERLTGKYSRAPGHAPIVLWERANGSLEVITGRHRLDLARSSGEKTIPAHIVKESEGFTREQALSLDAESNIRDEKGSVTDYARYFKGRGYTAREALDSGLLGRAKGKWGHVIGTEGSSALFGLLTAGKIGDKSAYEIARNAPNNEAVQAAALKEVNSMSADELGQFARTLSDMRPNKQSDTGDLFGFDDSAINEAKLVSKEASKEIKRLKQDYLIIERALKNPDAASAKWNIKVSESKKSEATAMLQRINDLERVFMRPELYAEMAKRAGIETVTQKPREDLHASDNITPSGQIRPELRAPEQKTLFQTPGELFDAVAKDPAATKAFFESQTKECLGINSDGEMRNPGDATDTPIPGPDLSSEKGSAQIPGVDSIAGKITDAITFVQEAQKAAPTNSELKWDLGVIETQAKADEVRAKKLIESAVKEGLTNADEEAIYHYAEALDVHGHANGEVLTPRQMDLYEKFIRPIMEAEQSIYSQLKTKGVIMNDHPRVHREAVGKHGVIDRVVDAAKGAIERVGSIVRGNSLSRTAPQFKRRSMMALEDDAGKRMVVHIKDDGTVLTFNKGKSFEIGSLDLKPYEKLRANEIDAVDAQIKKLDEEYGILTKTDKRIKSSSVRIKNIEEKIAALEASKQAITDKYSAYDLKNKVFSQDSFDAQGKKIIGGGKRWRLTDATTREIEAATKVQYHKNILLNQIGTFNKIRQVERATAFLESWKADKGFNDLAVKIGSGGEVPKGWKACELPQFRGYAFEPRIADTLNKFQGRIAAGDDPLNVLTGINGFLRTAIFFNPLIHIPNIAVHWAVNRGVMDAVNFTTWGRLARTTGKAFKDVLTQNENYVRAQDSGANMLFSSTDGVRLTDLMVQKVKGELEGTPDVAAQVAKALGYVNPIEMVKRLYKFSGQMTWFVNDLATLQAMYEHAEKHGVGLDVAAQEVSKHIPDYRVPARVMDSKILGDIMTNPNLTMFGAYHYGALKSYGEMAKEMMKKVPLKDKADAIDKLAMLGLTMIVVYPLLDQIAKKLTGNPDAQFRRAGATTLPSNTIKFVQGKIDSWRLFQSVVTPSVGTKEMFELLANRSIDTGKKIYNAGTEGQDIAAHVKQAVSPIDVMTKVSEGSRSWGETAASLAGMSTPHNPPHTAAERLAANMNRAKVESMPQTDESRKHYLLKRGVIEQYQSGNKQALEDAIKAGDLSHKERKLIISESKQSRLERDVKRLEFGQLIKVIEKATPDEMPLLDKILRAKYHNKMTTAGAKEKDKIRELYKEYQSTHGK